jgi:hypothetical protein
MFSKKQILFTTKPKMSIEDRSKLRMQKVIKYIEKLLLDMFQFLDTLENWHFYSENTV